MCARPCEDACRRKEIDAPIGICYLKRVAADYRGETRREVPPPWNGMTAAVVGAGVNGLTVARDLARKGYKVTIYERYPVPGGVMWAGVPEWRLPRDVIYEEVSLITDLGIDVQYDTEVGRDISLHELAEHSRRGHHLSRVPDCAGTWCPQVSISSGFNLGSSSSKTSIWVKRTSGSANASSPSAAASPRWTAFALSCGWALSSRS